MHGNHDMTDPEIKSIYNTESIASQKVFGNSQIKLPIIQYSIRFKAYTKHRNISIIIISIYIFQF